MANLDPQGYVSIAGFRYKVLSYQYSDQTYFAPPARQGLPRYADFTPETVLAWRSWHHGFGDLYLEDQASYYDSVNLDASVKGQITLGPAVGTTSTASGAQINELIRQFVEFQQTLFAVGSTSVFRWNPAASPNGWKLSGSFAPQVCGQATVFNVNVTACQAGLTGGPYLMVPTASSQKFFGPGVSGSWVSVATWAAHLTTIRNELWKAYYIPSVVNLASPGLAVTPSALSPYIWQIAKSADGVSFPNGNTFPWMNGVATINGLMSYDNRLYVMGDAGVQTLDSAGTVYDLIPEIGKYGNPHIGKGADTYHGVAYIPSDFGLLQFYGSAVVNPQVDQALKSVGPDQKSASQSPVRGHFSSVAPHVNFMYGGLNSVDGDSFLVKYRDYPDLLPGQGWHQLASFPAATIGCVHVSALPWYGTDYPIVWTSVVPSGGVGGIICQARLPNENDNVLIDPNVTFAKTGYLDLPIIDDLLPTFSKTWGKFVLDIVNGPNTYVEMQASLDGGSYNPIGAIAGTSGVFSFDFVASASANVSRTIQPRITLVTGTNNQTPAIRSVALHHLIEPPLQGRWELELLPQAAAVANDNETSTAKIAALRSARAPSQGFIPFTDLFGQSFNVDLVKLDWRYSALEANRGAQMVASVVLQDFNEQNFFLDHPSTLFDYALFSD